MEWIDLSDVVSITFNDNILRVRGSLTTISAYFWGPDDLFFRRRGQTAKGMLCKVVGYRHDTENKTSEFDLEEII